MIQISDHICENRSRGGKMLENKVLFSSWGTPGGADDVVTALRKTFNNAKNKVKSKYRGDSSRRKEYE